MLRALATIATIAAAAAGGFTASELAALDASGVNFSSDQLAMLRSRRQVGKPIVTTRRDDATGHDDIIFEVGAGGTAGMQVGDSSSLFNDYLPNLIKVGEGNVGAMAIGAEVGKNQASGFTSTFESDIASKKAKAAADEITADHTKLLTKTLSRLDEAELRIKRVETKCVIGKSYEKTAAKGSTLADYVAPVCEPLTKCKYGEYEKTAPAPKSDRVCAKLTACKKAAEFESKPPTPFSDRKCKAVTTCHATNEYQVAGPTEKTDRICAQVSKCKAGQFETVKATATSDRVCDSVATSCFKHRAQGHGKFKIQKGGEMVEVWCRDNGDMWGSDGSTKNKAGKSCGTIRSKFQAAKNQLYWVFMDNEEKPIQVWCDMNSCGNDGIGLGWGKRGKDYAKCGGWSLAAKIAGESFCSNNNDKTKGCWRMNRNYGTEYWRYGKEFGSENEAQENALRPSYNRQDFSDIMMRTIEPRVKSSPWRRTGDHSVRPWQSVAWRHPWVKRSVRSVAQACRPLQDGQPLHPNGAFFSRGQTHHMFARGINWASRSESQHHLPANPRSKWGFFLHDGGGCANNRRVVGCDFEWSGHARNFIGYGLDEANTAAFRGGGWGHRITSFGMGSGYCSASGGYGSRDRWSMTGHWWGHGASNMQARSTALFVRNKFDMEDHPWQNEGGTGAYDPNRSGEINEDA